MYKKLSSKGFTLIELLIVIIIIGILAAIAFVAYSGATNKAHQAAAQSELSEVKNKLAEYYATNSSYPATQSDLDNWLASSAGGNNKTMAATFVQNTASTAYGYSVTPSGCGDTVATSGTITAGTTACTGFSITAGTAVAPNGAITVTN